ncbi:MAG: hypothetical protein ACRCVI_02160 [Mycoplasmoidaceae bacterium]
MKSNATQFGGFTKKPDNYNSMVDEFRRNKILYGSKRFNIPVDELFKILEIVVKKTFKIKRELENGLKFHSKNKKVTLYYEIEKYDPEAKEIIIHWTVDNDKYWLSYKVKGNEKRGKINYKQIIFREKTFFGMQDAVGMHLYKMSFRKNVRAFNKSINHVKNNPNLDD